MQTLFKSIPLSLITLTVISGYASADEKYDFALHGYLRSGSSPTVTETGWIQWD